jgi:hypothetical protein
MQNPLDLFSISMLLILSLLVVLRIQAFMVKRALTQVIDRFKTNNSLCSQGSKTVDELELQPPSFLERIYKPRDYKPYALKILIRAGAVRLSDDGKMCLLERKLQRFRQDSRL